MKIDGLDALSRKLHAMPAEAKAEVRKALDKSAAEMAATAKALAPIDEGELKSSISVEDGKHDLQVFVRTGAEHAAYVEFGSADGAEPVPFFWPAYRSMKPRHNGRMTRAINKAAKMVAGK